MLSAFVTLTAVIQSKKGLTESTFGQLSSIRETQVAAIESYFNFMGSSLKALATQESTIAAVEEFTDGFGNIGDYFTLSDSDVKQDLIKMYDSEYLGNVNYAIPRVQQKRSTSNYLPKSAEGRFLQHLFIYSNPQPTGQKEKYLKSSLVSPYSTAHVMYHKSLMEILDDFKLYDVFLVDTEGNVVYSVFKEKDFATNLEKGGVYANSGLGEVYKKN